MFSLSLCKSQIKRRELDKDSSADRIAIRQGITNHSTIYTFSRCFQGEKLSILHKKIFLIICISSQLLAAPQSLPVSLFNGEGSKHSESVCVYSITLLLYLSPSLSSSFPFSPS